MVIDIAGRCSFCSKPAGEVFGLAGVLSRPARVCNECIDICLEVLSDDLFAQPASPSPSRQYPDVAIPRTPAELKAFMEKIRKLLDQSETTRQRTESGSLSCSFCDSKQDQVRKLIVGNPSRTYICDICIGDAAALISMHC
jgi:ATP-dependent protease Clp ATPase subunit